ncbi:DMT family transporter [Primorskyibacter sp. S87]|uniref:DMT family transporter n=1 Tax=Primorskyibacter sp. S87 TaxID=3415126 RepID=UPI003C7A68EE
MSDDRPVLGIFLMLGFCVVAPLGDAVAKLLGGYIPLGELLFARFAVQVLALAPLIFLTGRQNRIPALLKGRPLRLTLWRTALHIVGIGAMFTALKYLPLADAVAIAFVMPFIMLLLGRFVLNEEVGIRRITACAVGFAGTLMVIQPSFAEVGLPALWPLLVAVVFALFMLVTRQLARDTDPIALQAVSGVFATAILTPALLIGHSAGFEGLSFVWPDLQTFWLLLAIGLLGTLGHLLMTWALRYAPSATLAPMQYLEIPVATTIGWLIFHDLPDGLSAIGICVTIGAGLYVILREQATARLRAAQQNPSAKSRMPG